jgi:N-acyl-D-aspartate/D-glutamate deacylase
MRPLALLLFLASPLSAQASFDVVISGGRVIDPASNLDAVRNVGIRDGKVVIVTDAPLTGRTRIDARGLVVAPGFIDLHAHAQTDEGYWIFAMDG